jgi:hypothetical protein
VTTASNAPAEAETAAPRRGRRPLSRVVRYTWSRQWPAEALMGLCNGVVNLVAFSLQRSMGAPEWTSPALVVLGQGLWILAPAWPPLLARRGHQSTFAWVGWLSRGPFLLVTLASVTPVLGGKPGAGMGAWWILFAAFLVSNNLDAIYTPHRNALIRANYPLEARGRVYGMVTLVIGAAAIASSQAVGWLLDEDPVVVRWIFPVAGVLGIAAHLLLARIRWRYDGPTHVQHGRGLALVRDALAHAWSSTRRTLATDRNFRDYEIGFMLYGLGLLSATPLVVTRFAQDPVFSTADWARADRLVLPVTQIALVWVVGRLSDAIGVGRVAALSFGLLVPFFAWIAHVATPDQLAASYVLFGAAMAGVNVAWALGPLHFAPPGMAHHYSSVHVACVGIRSVMGPLVGWLVQAAAGFRAAMWLAVGLEAAAAVWTWRLAGRAHGAPAAEGVA